MGISFILAAARKEMGLGQDGTGWTRTRERVYGLPRGYALAGRELGVGGWELECWLAGRGTGVRLAVTFTPWILPSLAPRFTLHASLTGLHLVEGSPGQQCVHIPGPL
jgi:hypothetical protein